MLCCSFAHLPVDSPYMYIFTLYNQIARDVRNDHINGQLETLLLRLQDLDATCAVEQSKEDSGNSSFLNVCTTLKIVDHNLSI